VSKGHQPNQSTSKDQPNFRDQVVEKFQKAFGKPEAINTSTGNIFRWVLQRGQYEMSVIITIDSPEFTDMGHIMISDGCHSQIEPVVAVTVHTHAEVDALIGRIHTQWKSNTCQVSDHSQEAHATHSTQTSDSHAQGSHASGSQAPRRA
jgi:hypothetical protein